MNKQVNSGNFTFIHNLNNWLDQNCDRELDVKVIADAMCMERTSLYRNLKKSKGVGIKAYVAIYRIERALEMYRKGENSNLTQLAYTVGFGDYRDFARRCWQFYNCSPKHLMGISTSNPFVEPNMA